MSGNIMKNFVYISNEYRDAWKQYVENPEKLKEWENFNDDFKEEFKFKLEEEQHLLQKVNRPPSWFLNDKLGEKEFLFNMSQDHYPTRVDYEYTNDLPSFSDIMFERAIELRDKGKVIDLFYSGGIDSVAILYALAEVCPKDQLRIIMGDETSINYYPKGYKEIVGHLSCEFADGNIFGMAHIDTNLFTTGCEAERLFGGVGYPHSRNTNKERYTYEKDYDFHHDNWWNLTRFTWISCSMRYLQNINIEKFPIENYQPFYLCPALEKFSINNVLDRNMVWGANRWVTPEHFLKTKMELRNFIARWDKEYAYSMHKTDMPLVVQREMILPIPTNYNVLAITGNGTIVSSKNIMDYMKRECLTI